MKLKLEPSFLYNLTFSKLKKKQTKTIDHTTVPLCFKILKFQPKDQVKKYQKICFLALVAKIIPKTKVESGVKTTVSVN